MIERCTIDVVLSSLWAISGLPLRIWKLGLHDTLGANHSRPLEPHLLAVLVDCEEIGGSVSGLIDPDQPVKKTCENSGWPELRLENVRRMRHESLRNVVVKAGRDVRECVEISFFSLHLWNNLHLNV